MLMADEKKDLDISELPEQPVRDDPWDELDLAPNRPLSHRHREVARLAAHGKRNVYIAKKLNYHPGSVSTLLSQPKIQKEIHRVRDRLFSADIQARMKELSNDALDVMEDILLSDHISTADKETAAKWVLEKVSGKAAQQIEHKGEVSIGVFLEKLDSMKSLDKVLEAAPITDIEARDSTTVEKVVEGVDNSTEASDDAFGAWLDKNLV